MITHLNGRSLGKHYNTVWTLRYNSHSCHVSNIMALFKAYRCPSCDQIIFKAGNLERQMRTSKHWVMQNFPINVYQLRETLFDKPESFSIAHTDNQKLLNNMVISDFETIVWTMQILRITKKQHGWEAKCNCGVDILQPDTRTHFDLQS